MLTIKCDISFSIVTIVRKFRGGGALVALVILEAQGH